jgi:hypothetical protein
MCGKYTALQSLQIFDIIVLRAEIFGIGAWQNVRFVLKLHTASLNANCNNLVQNYVLFSSPVFLH